MRNLIWVMEQVDVNGLTGVYSTGNSAYSQHDDYELNPPMWTNDINNAVHFDEKWKAEEWIENEQLQAEATEHELCGGKEILK